MCWGWSAAAQILPVIEVTVKVVGEAEQPIPDAAERVAVLGGASKMLKGIVAKTATKQTVRASGLGRFLPSCFVLPVCAQVLCG